MISGAYSYDPTDPFVMDIKTRTKAHDPALLENLLAAMDNPAMKMSQIGYIARRIEHILADTTKPYIVHKDVQERIADVMLAKYLEILDQPGLYPEQETGSFAPVKDAFDDELTHTTYTATKR